MIVQESLKRGLNEKGKKERKKNTSGDNDIQHHKKALCSVKKNDFLGGGCGVKPKRETKTVTRGHRKARKRGRRSQGTRKYAATFSLGIRGRSELGAGRITKPEGSWVKTLAKPSKRGGDTIARGKRKWQGG